MQHDWWHQKWSREISGSSEEMQYVIEDSHFRVCVRKNNFTPRDGNWIVAFLGDTGFPFFADDWPDAIRKGCELIRKKLREFLNEFNDAEKMTVWDSQGNKRFTHDPAPFDI